MPAFTNTWNRIKTEFILKNSSAYTRLRFAVSFTGLTYNDSTGELTSTTDGLVWGSIDKPTAKDANNADVTVTATYTDVGSNGTPIPPGRHSRLALTRRLPMATGGMRQLTRTLGFILRTRTRTTEHIQSMRLAG